VSSGRSAPEAAQAVGQAGLPVEGPGTAAAADIVVVAVPPGRPTDPQQAVLAVPPTIGWHADSQPEPALAVEPDSAERHLRMD